MRSLSLASLLVVALPLTAQVAAKDTAKAAVAVAAVKPFSAADSARFMALGKRATDFMLNNKPDSLLAMMPPENADEMGGVEGAKSTIAKTEERIGKVSKVLVQKLTRRNGLPQFWYEGDFTEFTEEPVVMRFVFSEEGKLVGFGMSPKSMAKFDVP